MNTIELARGGSFWRPFTASLLVRDAAPCEHGLVRRDGACASCGLDALRVKLQIHDRVTKRGYRGGMWTD